MASLFLIAERDSCRAIMNWPPTNMQMRVGYGIRCFSWCIVRAGLEKDAVEFTHASSCFIRSSYAQNAGFP